MSNEFEINARIQEYRKRFKYDFPYYAVKCLYVRPKELGGLIPFRLNTAQIYVHNKLETLLKERGLIRVNILKGRQQGMSTYIEARFFWKVSFNFGVRAFILTHLADATRNLFEMTKRYYDNSPEFFKPHTKYNSGTILDFDKLDSGFRVGTAGNKNVGISGTIQYFHGSEIAFWENAWQHESGILECIPNSEGTEIVRESTANGTSNYFYEQWQIAEEDKNSDYVNIFVPWFWQNEYRSKVSQYFVRTPEENDLIARYSHIGLNSNEQLQWRREKLSKYGLDGEWRFKQTYPNSPDEAFKTSSTNSIIKPEFVLKARKRKVTGYGKIIVGVDPARGGDSTAIIFRQGNKAFDLQYYDFDSIEPIIKICKKILESDSPKIDQMNIDVGGLGAGVYDALKGMGYLNRIAQVNFGKNAFNKEKYVNQRAEMWYSAAEWITYKNVEIPDSDLLHGDLIVQQSFPDKLQRRGLVAKEKLRAELRRSPDGGDALALTFHKSKKAINYKRDFQVIKNDDNWI